MKDIDEELIEGTDLPPKHNVEYVN